LYVVTSLKLILLFEMNFPLLLLLLHTLQGLSKSVITEKNHQEEHIFGHRTYRVWFWFVSMSYIYSSLQQLIVEVKKAFSPSYQLR
jgi:hypothetical protein